MNSTSVSASLDLTRVRVSFTGRLITPDDPEYDAARALFYGGMDRRPALILRPTDTAEVAYVIGLARQTGLPLAVRSGGHGIPGFSILEGGLVLDLSAMKAMEFDVPGLTAWAQAGLTAAEFTEAAGAHGLVTGFGDTGTVGLGGITLGGGVGFLSRKFGLTIDELLAAEVVTASGQVRRVDESHDPDLFWAIRGGGGNFGVATRFKLRLHPLPSVVGGMLMLPATAEVITGFIAAAMAAPEELTTIANLLSAPPMPFLPEALHGQLAIMALMVYAGETEAGQRALAPFRALATPLADFLQPMPYANIYQPDDPNYHPLGVSRNLFLDHFDQRTAELILSRLKASDAMMPVTQLRVLGGAVARVPNDATAYAHRQRPIMVNVAALYAPGELAKHTAWVDAYATALAPGDSASYVNFLGEEGAARVRAAYPGPTWDRLRRLKARYDPDNLFRGNQNIPPAAAQ